MKTLKKQAPKKEQRTDDKRDDKATAKQEQAQCCAKVSRNVAGCHD